MFTRDLSRYSSPQRASPPSSKSLQSHSPMLLVYLLISLFIEFASSKQFYDLNPCSSDQLLPGSRYTCDASSGSCNTFLVYRSQPGFDTISSISSLFALEPEQVLRCNHLTNPSQILQQGHEVLIPIRCSCNDGYFQFNVSYLVLEGVTYYEISCEVFEGLVKLETLTKENSAGKDDIKVGAKLTVPLKCACPDSNDTRDGIQYLVTYPLVEGDKTVAIGQKFGIQATDIWAQNRQEPFATVYPNTTILIPLQKGPVINYSVTIPSDHDPFIPVVPLLNNGTDNGHTRQISRMIIVPSIGVPFALIALVGLGCFFKARHRWKDENMGMSLARSSTALCLSPDMVAGLSKYSLISYSMEELKEATGGFSDETMLGASVHLGRLGGTELVIKKMSFADACRTINIHAQINHTNIVTLKGVCYGESELCPSYLVFELAQNGCLRDCLNNTSDTLPWHRRTQIAFDVAVGLHYIHHCIVPSYIHMNINSRNILITEDWRAKIANFGAGSVINSSKERGDIVITIEGWISPEYLDQGSVSTKVDVFAFGVVLFELICGKEARDEKFIMKSLGFLKGGQNVNCYFEELQGFMDPCLKDYPIEEVLCLTVLAKACVEDDPLHRPSMDDILKILARMSH